MSLFSRKPREMQSDESLAYAVVDKNGKVEYMSDGIDNCKNVIGNSVRCGINDLSIRRIAYRFLSKGISQQWVES